MPLDIDRNVMSLWKSFEERLLNTFSLCLRQEDPKPPLSHENLIINELIREYLDYNHYKVGDYMRLLPLCSDTWFVKWQTYKSLLTHMHGKFTSFSNKNDAETVTHSRERNFHYFMHEDLFTTRFPNKCSDPPGCAHAYVFCIYSTTACEHERHVKIISLVLVLSSKVRETLYHLSLMPGPVV
jgi:hypothetical protein